MNRPVILLVALMAPRAAVPEPQLPAPEVSLRVDATDPTGPWKLVVTNRSAASLRFAADGRLLVLEVRTEGEPFAQGKKKRGAVTCKLPAGMRPGGVSEDRAVVLPPGARYEELVSPALYCFGAAERAALTAGTTLVPKLGFDVPRGKSTAPSAPFVAEPIALSPTVASIKEIVGEPFVVPPASPPPSAPQATAPVDPGAPELVVETPARLDAADADSVDLTVTVKNTGKRPASVRLRRDSLLFAVDGPNGLLECGVVPGARTIPRDLYGSLRGGGAESLTVRLIEPCPDDAFSRPGLYRIRAKLVVPDTGEKTPGVRPWTGRAIAKEPTLVRVRTGQWPFYRSGPVVLTRPANG